MPQQELAAALFYGTAALPRTTRRLAVKGVMCAVLANSSLVTSSSRPPGTRCPMDRNRVSRTPASLCSAEWQVSATKDKERLLGRVRRIRGQVEAIERALDADQECSSVLQLMAACRGALNGLMAEVLEGHVRFHVLDPKSGKNSPQAEAAEELIDVVRRYLK